MSKSETILEKKCKGPCGKTLSLTRFPKNGGKTRDGHTAQCKDCVKVGNATRKARPGFRVTVTEKVCGTCKGNPQPVANFHRDKGNPDGHCTQCKSCRTPVKKAYYQDNREGVIAKVTAYNQAHPERVKSTLKNLAKWGKDNPEKVREANRRRSYARRARLRREAIMAMGSHCVCCNESDWRILTFDHIGGWGAEHRRELNHAMFVPWLIKHHYPTGNEICPECGIQHQGIQLMCFTCNMATTIHGTCPHQTEFNIVAVAMDQQSAIAAYFEI